MQHQIPHHLPRTTLQRNLDIIYAAQQRQRTKISSPLAAPTQPAPSQAHQAEGRGTSNLTPEKVQKLVRTCGAYPIAKMLAKRGYTCREARALMGV